MLKSPLHGKWHLIFCSFLLTLWQYPAFAQSSSESPDQQATASDQQIPPAIAKELDALKKRIAQLEAELRQHQVEAQPTTVVHTAKASTPLAVPPSPPVAVAAPHGG